MFLFAFMYFFQFIFKIVIGLELVSQTALKVFNFFSEFVHLLVVFLLQFVRLRTQCIQFIGEFGGSRYQIHILVVEFLIF